MASSATRVCFLDLPNETLCTFLKFLPGGQAALAMMMTCKRVYALFDENSKSGASIWTSIREKEGWPDPALIGITDFTFLRAMFGKGCDVCNGLENTEPRWEWKGMRVCASCMHDISVKEYDLAWEVRKWNQDAGVPSVTFVTRDKKRKITESRILRESVFVHEPTTTQVKEGTECKQQLQSFYDALKKNQERRNVRPVIARRKILKAIMEEKLPNIPDKLYNRLKCYETAYSKYTPFTPRSQSLFRTKLNLEIELNREMLTSKVVNFVADTLLYREIPCYYVRRGFEDHPQYKTTIETLKNQPLSSSLVSTIDSSIRALLPLATPLLQKRQLQERWEQLCTTYKVRYALQASALYKDANADREQDVQAFILIEENKAWVQNDWKRKYLDREKLGRLEGSDLFLEADPTKEEQFRSLVQVELVKLRKAQDEETLKKYDQGTSEHLFYCSKCDFCRGAAANAKLMQTHFAKSKGKCNVHNLGIFHNLHAK